VCYGTGDLATARRFARPSSRDVDQLSDEGVGVQRFFGLLSLCFPSHAPPVAPSPCCFATFQVCRRPLCRSIDGVPASARNICRGRPVITPHPVCVIQLRSNSDHAGKRYILRRNQRVSIKIQELRLSTRECHFLRIYVPSKVNMIIFQHTFQ